MELFPPSGPVGWLLINLVITIGLLLGYPYIPRTYRQIILNFHWVIIPYVALLIGHVSPRLMGLTGIDWLLSFGFGIGLVAAVLGLLVLVRSTTDFTPPKEAPVTGANHGTGTLHTQEQTQTDANGGEGTTSVVLPMAQSRAQGTYTTFTLVSIFNVGAEEFYWSFLRGALWESLQSVTLFNDQTGYWAVWLAALLALPEIFRVHNSMLGRLFKIILLLLTTVLFIYTQNFWLCWLLHALVMLLLIP